LHFDKDNRDDRRYNHEPNAQGVSVTTAAAKRIQIKALLKRERKE
jgi:hypothetical protein